MSNDNVLVGVGRNGDFVHQNQTMGKSEGFSNVSAAWLPNTISISEGIDKFTDASRRREDIECALKDMVPTINDDGMVVMEYVDGREFYPTEHAWTQIFTQCGRIPTTFVKWINKNVDVPGMKYTRDSLDQETLLTVLKNGYRRVDGKKAFKFRTYNDGTLRAMFTDQYAYIDNIWYLDTIGKLFKEIGGTEPRLSHFDRSTDDTIYGNILLPDSCRQDKDSDYGGMISVANCEIGMRVLSQFPSLFRAICMNGCIWDQSRGNIIRQVHRGEIDYADLTERITLNIHHQIPLIDEAVKRFLDTRDMMIKGVTLDKVFAQTAIEYGLHPKMARQVVSEFAAYERDNVNLFGVINSVTRAGQAKGFNSDDWVDMDYVGGKLMNLTNNKWEALLNRAKGLDKEQIEKAFGTVAV